MKNLFDQEIFALRGENDARLATLTTDLSALDVRIDTLESTVNAMANFIKATSSGKLIQSGSTVGTTDAGGGLVITFPTAFATAPVVVANNGDPQGTSADDWFVTVLSPSTTTTFTVVVNDSAGGRVGSTAIRVNWIAFGA